MRQRLRHRPVVHRRHADGLPGLPGQAPQGVQPRRRDLQRVGLLPHRLAFEGHVGLGLVGRLRREGIVVRLVRQELRRRERLVLVGRLGQRVGFVLVRQRLVGLRLVRLRLVRLELVRFELLGRLVQLVLTGRGDRRGHPSAPPWFA
ncbi:conserved hypothetical protein [Frigoribacterium sp. 9N]|nr:conserved hypothetical protein [Frigoribacterium sp. 9N]